MVIYTPDGFPGQRMRVLPRPLVRHALQEGVTSRLLVTDAGYFPHAANHGRHRPNGAHEAVLIVAVAGVGWCEAEGSVLRVSAGDALVLAPGTPHLYRADVADPWTVWWLHASGADLSTLLEPVLGQANAAVVRLHDPTRVTHSIETAVLALERDETAASLIVASGAAWSALAQVGADRVDGPRDHASPVHRVREHLLDNFAEPVSVPELAAMVGLSSSHLTTLFRQSTGTSLLKYVRSLRMASARVMLATTTASVGEIARAVGYTDPFYFARQFRAVSGVSPTRFRAMHDGTA